MTLQQDYTWGSRVFLGGGLFLMSKVPLSLTLSQSLLLIQYIFKSRFPYTRSSAKKIQTH